MLQQFPWSQVLMSASLALILSCAETETPPPCAGDTCPAPADTMDPDIVDDNVEDTGADLVDTSSDTPDTVENADTDAGSPVDDTSVPDTSVDMEGPWIVQVSPSPQEDQVALPFTVTIQFNEPIRPETVDSTTFTITGPQNQSVGGNPQLNEDQTVVSLAPDPADLLFSSPYTLEVSVFVQDLLGNSMTGDYSMSFYTEGPDGLDTYANLAAVYAPVAWQETQGYNTHLDYPTRVNFDDNWISGDNPNHIAVATTVLPAVYWDVSETQSHLFLTYLYFYPHRNPAAMGADHVNDTAGAMLVFSKSPTLTPMEAITYSHDADVEDLRSYVVETSAMAEAALVDHVAEEETLFPDGRFSLYLGAPQHQACSWAVGGEGACELNEGITKFMTHVQYRYDQGIPTPLEKIDGDWPKVLEAVDFELISGLTHLWARRNLIDVDALYMSHFNYEPSEAQPGGELDMLPSFFSWTDGAESGRPYWAWAWNPSSFAPFTDLPRGTFFLDPAYFLYKRHSLENSPTWSSEDETGWSLKYCFHPVQGIDQRGVLVGCDPLSF